MKEKLEKTLIDFSKSLNMPVYLVGGAVRNYLISSDLGTDFDLASSNSIEDVLYYLKIFEFKIDSVYKRTGTIKFTSKNGVGYEYTSFRTEQYNGGEHTPFSVDFTSDIVLDAKRRDFKCNAVYYDIKNSKFVDPLGGIEDIKNKIISAVDVPEKVFCFDGLRLMRLVRLSMELDFNIEPDTLTGATKYSENILSITNERIYEELSKILLSDCKYSFSNKEGHYLGLELLHRIKVLKLILPELCLGEDMPQRADFHKYNVLEHSLRTVLYSDKSIRLSALFHDIGKPYAMINFGKYYSHAEDGEKITREILSKWKASKKVINETCFLVKNHMLDLDLKMKENKIKLFIVKNINMIDKLLLLKQADYSAGKDNRDVAKTVEKWKLILKKLYEDKVPFSLKDLEINGNDLKNMGYKDKSIKEKLSELFDLCIINSNLNNREKLLEIIRRTKIDR